MVMLYPRNLFFKAPENYPPNYEHAYSEPGRNEIVILAIIVRCLVEFAF